MSTHQRRDFPPHWDPPPKQGALLSSGSQVAPLLKVIKEMDRQPTADWVQKMYLEKLSPQATGGWLTYNNEEEKEELRRFFHKVRK